MLRRILASLLTMALLVACSSSTNDGAGAPDDGAAPPQGQILPPADPDALDEEPPQDDEPVEVTDDGRLVVQGLDGQLSTMLPDGTEPMVLTDDPNTVNSQPSWAPDGSRIAWVSTDRTTGDSSINLDRFDRSDFRQVPLDANAPFYLYWDPSAARIAYLSPATGGLDLTIAEPFAEDGPTTRRIDRGQPYFLSWGPDGDEMLVHASGFRLDRIDLGSATIIIDEFPGSFGAPAWLPDGSLAFTDIDGEEQFLVTTGTSGEGRRPLITYDGTLQFSISNQGNRIVMQAIPGTNEDSVVTASTEAAGPRPAMGSVAVAQQPTPTPEFDDSLDPVDRLVPGIPYVMGIFGGEPFPLSGTPARALFPSPDGQSVAWFEDSFVGPNAVSLRIDTNGSQFTSLPFIPSAVTTNEYWPFFDQYEQSHDFWSPSSQLFVFAGRPADLPNSQDGIWVFDLEAGELSRIADGVIASFTRTPTAAGAASSL